MGKWTVMSENGTVTLRISNAEGWTRIKSRFWIHFSFKKESKTFGSTSLLKKRAKHLAPLLF
jgi:hypothetical protein